MSRRAKVRWISYFLALAVCLAATLVACFTGAKRYEARINADTGRAMGEAVNAVSALDRSLQKSACATTPGMIKTVCTEIYSDAQMAESAISVLPVKSSSLEQIARHIAVLGDYAAMLSRTTDETQPAQSALQDLAQFSDTTSKLCGALTELQRMIADDSIQNETFKRITDTLDNLEDEASADAVTMEMQMESIAKAFPEIPTLVYDGKYTDHSKDVPKALETESACTKQDALKAAAQWLGCNPDELHQLESVESEIPCYCFEGKNLRLAVTKLGAKTLWMMSEAPSGDAEYTQEQAEDLAFAYLRDRGIDNMEITNTVLSGGEAAVRFCPLLDGEILCYQDEITVNVSLVNGEITGYHARDYLMHHTDQRDVSVLNGDKTKTDAAVPAFLTVKSVRPVILPAIGTEERACYQYTCTDQNGAEYQICVNAGTGEQEQILLSDEV